MINVTADCYSLMPIQAEKFIKENHLDFFEGNLIKYLQRHFFKNGLQDIRQAASYMNKVKSFDNAFSIKSISRFICQSAYLKRYREYSHLNGVDLTDEMLGYYFMIGITTGSKKAINDAIKLVETYDSFYSYFENNSDFKELAWLIILVNGQYTKDQIWYLSDKYDIGLSCNPLTGLYKKIEELVSDSTVKESIHKYIKKVKRGDCFKSSVFIWESIINNKIIL